MARQFSTKAYSFFCCFRPWKAANALLRGSKVTIKMTFESESLDEQGYVQDFGQLKEIKDWLEGQYDRTTIIAEDDPKLDSFKNMEGAISLQVVPAVSCEAFAQSVYEYVEHWLHDDPTNIYENLVGDKFQRVKLYRVEVFENETNSATYEG